MYLNHSHCKVVNCFIQQYSWSMTEEMRAYQAAAMEQAEYGLVEDGDGWWGRIPGFKGLITFGATEQEVRAELASVLEGWIEVSLRFGDGLPTLHDSKQPLSISH
jgi:predicted RNase H-like HicB family nuclease